MTLNEWLRREGVSPTEFGRSIGVSHTTVYRWINGRHPPEPQTMKRIISATHGDVTANDLLEQSSRHSPSRKRVA